MSGSPYEPTVPSGAELNNFEIKVGGVLNFAPSGSLTIYGSAAAKNDGTINLGTGSITFLGDITIQNNGTFDAGSGNIEMNGGTWDNKNGSTFDAGDSTVTFNGDGDQTIQGDITFNNVVVNTTGTLTMEDTVTADNFDLNEGSTLDAPDLVVNDTFNVEGDYDSATTITVKTNANLVLLKDNAINDGTNLILAGGTFETSGFDETLDTLTLSASSIIDFSGGTSAINFADSSGETWSGTLVIQNYTPLDDSLYIGSSGAGLTQDQVDKIQFVNPYGNGVDYTAVITMAGEIVIGSAVVPEPSTVFAIIGLCLVIGLHEVRRFFTPSSRKLDET